MVLPVSVWERVKAMETGNNIAELRGWVRERVGPRYSYLPTVYEICSPCLTHRDVYLRRVMRYKVEPSRAMTCGSIIHKSLLEPFRHLTKLSNSLGNLTELLVSLKSRLLRNVPRELRKTTSMMFDLASALAVRWIVDERKLPILVEPYIEASSIGIADGVRPDLVVGLIPVDFLVTSGNNLYFERKRLAVTAYGMALESMTGNPVDFGVIALVRVDGIPRILWRIVQLTDELRARLLEERDEVARVAEQEDDPGRAPFCPKTCPWREICYESPCNI